MQIDIFGEKRFTEDVFEFRGYALRFARCLKHFVALPNPDLKSIAECAAGLAAAELQIDERQQVCEIASGEHPGKAGFARIVPDDHRIFVRFDGACACTIARTTPHEMKHRSQVISGNFIRMYANGTSEPDAEAFAAGIMRKYHFTCDCGKSY